MKFLARWIDDAQNAAQEERATLCELRVNISGENACRHFDEISKEPLDCVTVPAVHLAEGLSTDWWSIFGRRDQVYSIRRYRTGFAVPDVTFRCDGTTFQVEAKEFVYGNPALRFPSVDGEVLSRDEAEKEFSRFITQVGRRLNKSDIASELGLCWTRVRDSLKDADKRAFCEAAGALGIDPYAVSDADAHFIESAGDFFSGDALLEFLAGLETSNEARSLDWIEEAEREPAVQSSLPELGRIANQVQNMVQPDPNEPGWMAGYRAARAFRDAMNVGPDRALASSREIAGMLGSDTFKTTLAVKDVLALISQDEEDTRIHLYEPGHTKGAIQSNRFAFARAIGDVVCFRHTRRSVVNRLHNADRQSTGRAFAAEFLAPVEYVIDMVSEGLRVEEVSSILDVSPVLVSRQIENQDRIRRACSTACL